MRLLTEPPHDRYKSGLVLGLLQERWRVLQSSREQRVGGDGGSNTPEEHKHAVIGSSAGDAAL